MLHMMPRQRAMDGQRRAGGRETMVWPRKMSGRNEERAPGILSHRKGGGKGASKARTAHTKPTSCNGRVRGSAAAYRPAALPGRGSAEHGGELRGHTRGGSPMSKPAGPRRRRRLRRARSRSLLLGMPATCGGALRRARQRNPSARPPAKDGYVCGPRRIRRG